MGLQFGVRQMF